MIKAGSSLFINFRNVFPTTVSYSYGVSDPAFHVDKSEETLQPHKDTRIAVGYNMPATVVVSRAPSAGKLIVCCSKSFTRPNENHYQWVYYLRGVASDN